MTDPMNTPAAAAEGGRVSPALRAGNDAADRAYSDFIAHVADCADCRTGGVDCKTAAGFRQIWRNARRG
ncbi:hypothetical protein AB0C77_06465 [Streptomyces sp. NPDC048629]|uniref:hypothetical protein n=1 Tax=Streptomyces sp. NPDC048629 TaxID=3154824 RepID=UPI0034237837